ncbi:MAG: hypothetical protein K0S44_662 [Bacteroidetes bacterium]|nr:hypothetical protein [Bacteroidota bacterium]
MFFTCKHSNNVKLSWIMIRDAFLIEITALIKKACINNFSSSQVLNYGLLWKDLISGSRSVFGSINFRGCTWLK